MWNVGKHFRGIKLQHHKQIIHPISLVEIKLKILYIVQDESQLDCKNKTTLFLQLFKKPEES